MFNIDPSTLFSKLIILLIAFPIHELAHAVTANYFGDDTPRMNGRLTLNPIAHLDPIGSLLLLVSWFGWAKPVPVNPYTLQRRSPAAMMWVSLAGPFSNLLMAIAAAIPFRLGMVSSLEAQLAMSTGGSHFWPTLPQILWIFIYLNLLLMLFNLIPIAPLDGEKIAEYFFTPSMNRFMDNIRPYGPIILLAVIFVGVLSWIILPPLSFLMRLLVG